MPAGETERWPLEELLEAGPLAHGYGDQDWTLARIAEVIDHRSPLSFASTAPI